MVTFTQELARQPHLDREALWAKTESMSWMSGIEWPQPIAPTLGRGDRRLPASTVQPDVKSPVVHGAKWDA